MRTILVTASDTGVGKTQVAATLARLLAATGAGVRIVKAVETGQPDEPDADRARRLAAFAGIEAATLFSFPEPLAPVAAARRAATGFTLAGLLEAIRAQPASDWRIIEGAGGIATPLDDEGRDWADLAGALGVDAVVVVVADRLGAINQGRLALARARAAGRPAGVWLNALDAPGPVVAASNRDGLKSGGVEVWAEQECKALEPRDPRAVRDRFLSLSPGRAGSTNRESATPPEPAGEPWTRRAREELSARAVAGTVRTLRVTDTAPTLNLADNDYLALAHDPALVEAVVQAARRHGTSASASPLITGWKEPHAALAEGLERWHGFPASLLWSSGYAANAAVLGGLPRRGDLVLADRLIHHSMIAGILRSGARLQRYDHLDLDHLGRLLDAAGGGRGVFVATESVFSMDGDFPDLRRLAELRRRHGFCWILDEAHALGWYGRAGAGLASAAGVAGDVDILVGTLGKTLGSAGAYTLFREPGLREYLVNTAGEFIYSTAMPPTAAAAAHSALERVRVLSAGQDAWWALSRRFRHRLQSEGWQAAAGDSPIVPVLLQDPAAAVALAGALRDQGILAGAIRPPTVPAGTSRLRFSLKRTITDEHSGQVAAAMRAWRETQ